MLFNFGLKRWVHLGTPRTAGHGRGPAGLLRQLHIFPVNATDENVISRYGINIKNTQTEFQIDFDAILDTVDGIRSSLGYSDHRIDIWLCSDTTMSKYNTLWRGPKKQAAEDEDEEEELEEQSEDGQEETPKFGTKDANNRQIGRVRRASVASRKAKSSTGCKPEPKKKAPVLNSTDILSFPALDFTAPGVRSLVSQPNSNGSDSLATEKHLGDVIVSLSYIHRQCRKDRKMDEDGFEFDFEDDEVGVFRAMSNYYTVQERLPLLLVHGCVHLLGYDHETDYEWGVMTRREEQIIQDLRMVPERGVNE